MPRIPAMPFRETVNLVARPELCNVDLGCNLSASAGRYRRSAAAAQIHAGCAGALFRQGNRQLRLVKVADPRRRREMKVFAAVLAVMLALVMVYSCSISALSTTVTKSKSCAPSAMP